MYSYKFTDDDSQSLSSDAEKFTELEDKFNEIDSKYEGVSVDESKYDSSLDLERKTFEELTDEQIESQAKDSLKGYENESKQSIENDYLANKEAIDENLAQSKISKDELKETLKQDYDEAKVSASNDAIKRGLARSSIIVNKLAKFDESMLGEFTQIEKDYLTTTENLTTQKNLLEVQKQNALDSFDIAYAVKLGDKINSITEQLQAKEAEVIEYNNKMEQLEKEYEAEMLNNLADAKNDAGKSNLDYLEYVSKYGIVALENVKAKEKYDATLKYLNGLSKEKAISELENNSFFKNQLKNYYETLVKDMQKRE